MSTHNGRTIVIMPTGMAAPSAGGAVAPAEFEFEWESVAGENVNPFNKQQQVYDWQANTISASVSLPAIIKANFQAWIAFFQALDGVANVFQFPAAVCAAYPAELYSTGTTPRFWQLAGNKVKWTAHKGNYYSCTFEITQALP